ncbi:MAG TPA: response regulator [Gemmatimonadaceae bacterium]|nr:response regulator [Gemmatimonadaceae bacterium]
MRVIFADDNPEARALLSAVLAELGQEAEGFEDGEHAWNAYRANPSPLVVLDLRMPGADGLELCRRIRAHESGDATFILIVTAHDDPGGLKAVLDAGADDYIAKPSSPKNLRARVEIAVRRVQQADALRTARADLVRARWLAGIGETALAMEREINGPLQSILERSSRLLEDTRFNDDQRDQLRIISEQGARLAGVIGRAVNLESPQSVEYLGGARMIDLSGEHRAVRREPPP